MARQHKTDPSLLPILTYNLNKGMKIDTINIHDHGCDFVFQMQGFYLPRSQSLKTLFWPALAAGIRAH